MRLHGRALVSVIVAATVVGLLGIAVGVLLFIQRDRVLPNTDIAGIEVGGLTTAEARAAVAPTAAERETEPVVLRFEDVDHVLVPSEVDYAIDVDASVEAAFARGRDGAVRGLTERVRSYRTPLSVPLLDHLDEEPIEAWVDALADELDRERFTGAVEVDPDTLEVAHTLAHGDVEVRRDETVTLIATALREPGADELELPADTTDAPVRDQDIEALAAQVSRALEAPIELRAGEASLTLEPAEVNALFDIVERPTAGERVTLELVVTRDRVAEVVGDEAERFASEPVSARITSNRTHPTGFDAQGSATFRPVAADIEVVPGEVGTRFDPELAAEQLTGLLRDGGRSVELRLEQVEPELSTERAEQLAPTHLIGTFTTYYTAGQTRNINIQRLADVIDDTRVMPGEQFSINGISGPRSCDRGYVPAGTIVRGELVDTCGGGTSQFGTTTFNAAFFAGLQLDDWKAHSWYISRYPMGREATLTYPSLDVRFTNNTEGMLIVRASHTASSVTVTIYGQPRATAVSARHGSPFAPRDFTTTNRTTDELYEDQERVVQSGAGGFTVEVVRTVELVGGGTETRTIRTVYVPQTRIIETGTRPRPEEPEPEPEPDDPPAEAPPADDPDPED